MGTERHAAVIVRIAGTPFGAEAIAAIAWSGKQYALYAPDHEMVDAVIREFLAGSSDGSVEAGLEAFSKASHPYAIEEAKIAVAPSLEESARSALDGWWARSRHRP